MRKTIKTVITTIATVAMAASSFTAIKANELHCEWLWDSTYNVSYWIEYGEIQGRPGDPKNIWDTTYGIERGREIYDPESDAWYWLDACRLGAKAVDKEVWMPYIYQQDLAKGINKQGKWVRYDYSGRMIKGWCVVNTEGKKNGVCYYDLKTGAMTKGRRCFGHEDCYIYDFDEKTGLMIDSLGNIIPVDKALQYAGCAMDFGEIYYIVDRDGHAYRDVHK